MKEKIRGIRIDFKKKTVDMTKYKGTLTINELEMILERLTRYLPSIKDKLREILDKMLSEFHSRKKTGDGIYFIRKRAITSILALMKTELAIYFMRRICKRC